jgi:hypothetical protein
MPALYDITKDTNTSVSGVFLKSIKKGGTIPPL